MTGLQPTEHMLSQPSHQQGVRFPWWGTVVTLRNIALAVGPVEARLRRRSREISLAVEDNQDIAGRLRTVGMGLETLGLIRDPTAAANLVLRMRRDLELGEERLRTMDGRHGKLAKMVELDDEELGKARSGVNQLLQGGGVHPMAPPPGDSL